MTHQGPGHAPTGPATAEDTIALVGTHYGWRQEDGSPGPLTAQEFSHGFIIYPYKPPVPGPPQPAEAFGCVVVDKEDGRLTTLPFLGVEGTTEMYTRMRDK